MFKTFVITAKAENVLRVLQRLASLMTRRQLTAAEMNVAESSLRAESVLYRNGLKNREFDEKGLQNFCSERETIAERQGSSENKNFEVNPTKSKTDSSDYFGIDRMNFF